MDKNIVLIGQERDNKKDEGEATETDIESPTIGCGITPGFAKWLYPAVSFIVQCYKGSKWNPPVVKIAPNGKEITLPRTRARGVDFCMRIGQHPVVTTKFRVPKKLSLQIAESGVDYITDPSYFKVLAAPSLQ